MRDLWIFTSVLSVIAGIVCVKLERYDLALICIAGGTAIGALVLLP